MNVSERDIARAVADGCQSFIALQEKLEVGTNCGTCLCDARKSFSEQKARCCRSSQSPVVLAPLAVAV